MSDAASTAEISDQQQRFVAVATLERGFRYDLRGKIFTQHQPVPVTQKELDHLELNAVVVDLEPGYDPIYDDECSRLRERNLFSFQDYKEADHVVPDLDAVDDKNRDAGNGVVSCSRRDGDALPAMTCGPVPFLRGVPHPGHAVPR